jgi:hypothetical protein
MDYKMKPGSKEKNTPGAFRKDQEDKVTEAYKRQGINPSSFQGFNKATDTIIQGRSKNHGIARQIQASNASMGGYTHAKQEKTTRSSDGTYSVQKLYKK